ncbi:MAG: type II/IV secretion system protein [Thermoleophilaceae bacterium]|nr:type II/IV secretion system protein [Thermoleophilaceae bacterium]
MTPPRKRGAGRRAVGDVLVELGYLTADEVAEATREARVSGQRLEGALMDAGKLSPEQVGRATAERFGLDYVDLTEYRPDVAAMNLISAPAARRYKAVPIGFDIYEVLQVAVADPANILALDDVRLMTGHEVRPVVAPAEDIAMLIGKMNRLEKAMAEAIDEEPEEVDERIDGPVDRADDAPVIKLVNSVIAQAVEEGASDIHFEPEGRDMRVRFRIDGVLSATASIPRKMVPGVVSRLKIMGDLDIAERRLPQDGRLTRKVEGHTVDLRIVTLPSALGEGVVMRVLDKEQVLLSLDTLGMTDQARSRFEHSFGKPHGAVLVTGPTGSGKSTTLYTALNVLNTIEKNIITIEDPVEYQLPGITQVGVNARAGLTFPRGLRSALRADPDVIMVGEIRDADTARVAIESALTGHLVLSTLHTNDAASAITRLTEMGIEPFLTASALDCVVAQRLARMLCNYCKKLTVLSEVALREAGFEVTGDVGAYEPVGCSRCKHTGHKGRLGIFEVMTISEAIRSLALERVSAEQIRSKAIEEGMRVLRADGLEKVKLGLTSIAEVTRVVV